MRYKENQQIANDTRLQLMDDNNSEDWVDGSTRPPRALTLCKKSLLGGLVCFLVLLGMIIGAWITPPIAINGRLAEQAKSSTSGPAPRNIIMMISDGMGPASVSFSRTFYQYIHGLPYDHEMPLDTIHVGQSRTRSSSTLVTDSAAGATAFSCGLKTYNGAIGVDPKKNPCGTVLESAKYHRGMRTGLVATSRITHATPASFSAHVVDRDNENAIAIQQIGDYRLGRSVDLMFGGGYCHFLPKSDTRSCRKDERNLFVEANDKFGWEHVLSIDHNRTEFDALANDASVLPVLGLFHPDHMNYEIDRDVALEPSLTEMTDKALKILSSSSSTEQDEEENKGFFLMVEGSRIDMAAHSNDPVAHLHEILEYQNTIELVKRFVDEHPDTLMISTSDHETGGLSLARQVTSAYPKYLWYPDVLIKATQSTVTLANKIKAQASVTHDFLVKEILQKGLGIGDPTADELDRLVKIGSKKRLDQYLAQMISIRAQLGWATHGHSGVDVNLYAYGAQADSLRGSHENIEIGEYITSMLNLDLNELTTKLNEDNDGFSLKTLSDNDKKEYTNMLDTYHSNPKNLHHPPY
ncbi:alkaline phosphatase-like protein [Lichtheimia hyalospora FSU 10163]|nr:alkaline phosphatase-like protein [Lichtheimia hyalospora FSU 10163]